jgi:hypothetical protein
MANLPECPRYCTTCPRPIEQWTEHGVVNSGYQDAAGRCWYCACEQQYADRAAPAARQLEFKFG